MKIFKDPVVPEDQLLLLPPNVADFVAEDSFVCVLSELVDHMDCSALRAQYSGGGATAYDPVMLLKVLVFGCSQNIRSSRRLALALSYDLRFMYLARMSKPDFRTIARFRKSNEAAIVRLFAQTVVLARDLGLVLLDHVSVDGTKLEATASRSRYRRTAEIAGTLEKTKQQIEQILKEMEEADQTEDDEDAGGPTNGVAQALLRLRDRKKRYEKAEADRETQQQKSVVMTEPESRMMQQRGGILRPCYNAQAVVDSQAQVLVAAAVTQDHADYHQLRPMLDQVQETLGELPTRVSADSGYWSKDSLDYVEDQSVDAYIASEGQWADNRIGWTYDPQTDVWSSPEGEVHVFSTTKEHDGRTYRLYRCKKTQKMKWINDDADRMALMRDKVNSPEGKAIYSRRQAIVEPVFGHIKGPYGLRRLSLRGKKGAHIEFLLACITHNLGKMIGFRQEAALA